MGAGPEVEVREALWDSKNAAVPSTRLRQIASGELRDDGVGEGDDVGFDGFGGAS